MAKIEGAFFRRTTNCSIKYDFLSVSQSSDAVYNKSEATNRDPSLYIAFSPFYDINSRSTKMTQISFKPLSFEAQ